MLRFIKLSYRRNYLLRACRKSSIERNKLIFNFENGTLGASLPTIEEESIEVKATFGNTHRGAEEFDNYSSWVSPSRPPGGSTSIIDLLCKDKQTSRWGSGLSFKTTEELWEDSELNAIKLKKFYEILPKPELNAKSLLKERTKSLYYISKFLKSQYWFIQKIDSYVNEFFNYSEVSKNQTHEGVFVISSAKTTKIQQLIKDFSVESSRTSQSA